MANKLEITLEKIIFSIRWLQAPVYILLSFILITYIYMIFIELKHLFVVLIYSNKFNIEKLTTLTLTLCEAVLVANLVVMVIISGYENFVSKMNNSKEKYGQPVWIKKLSPDAVKIKIAGSIITISSISLLQGFLDILHTTDRELLWGVTIHIVFVVSALLISITSYIVGKYSHTSEPQ
nr:YqhA family protein [Francisella opportunistica]